MKKPARIPAPAASEKAEPAKAEATADAKTAHIRVDHGDAYLDGERITYDLEAPEAVLVIGRDLTQAGTKGLSKVPGSVCVGPANVVYAAVNVAFQRGKTKVEISEASEKLKERLSPWLAEIADLVDVQFT